MQQAKIFIACADPSARQNLKYMLVREGYLIAGEAPDGSQALRMIRTLQPNLVILDSDLQGTNALEVARVIDEDRVAPIILLASSWHRNLIIRTRDFPVFAYLIKPVQESTLIPAVEAALANYRRVTRLEQEISKLKETLASRKVVERAKGILMDTMGLTEAEAYRRLQRQSMDRCVPMKTIAEAIIVAHELQQGGHKAKNDSGNSGRA
ncbi:ANTAR domain-containing response regulator [Neomoorella thermoacetica]|uniref:Stage 0 sporulation protein A homolog n=3 Tax=Neomoorella thermoacetica TaxID=1525 RepID=A0A1D7XAU4_NEOTH|nr:ANTAR domain-containing protein [Moorella thermoacetica]AKX94071.1 putative transcriptional regulatory protein pdtaR [Moorella thermoacetica]AKX96710.1 putative transcriptional regulatory protein pdtaR [Moorella thermoacetica]AOQ24022.1 putative transcriptional regulatory protein pdtaR [Moorella thermoacetica]OIQ09233.1 putative transcriptional regulatory protein pdtaR [Moorella thermoacetica]OIQ12974.1 putative transcriptional regulatory protein pdtaR [Moorella thermoacetica]